jgi:hypothetical protein
MRHRKWNTWRGVRLALVGFFGLLGAQGVGCGGKEKDPCSCDVEGETGRLALECACADGDCGRTLQEVLADPCTGYAIAGSLLERGCGKVRISYDNFLTGGSSVYDEASGALIGVSGFSDIPVEPCNSFELIAGEELDCPTVTACLLCPNENTPPSSIPVCPEG